jgi:DNA (cytosine-5)-methyltransferase 1
LEVIKYDLALPVTVRKHEVDTVGLRTILREYKRLSKITNRKLSEALNRPITEVEHWFRTDACFSIPDPEIWAELKMLLGITSDGFDAPITEFIEKPGVFEKANRFYDIEGIAPTLTVAGADEKIFVEEGFKSTYKPKGDDDLTVTSKFNYVSLFSGIGGFEQALNKLGGTCVMASEIDKYANQAYEVLYGEPTVGDVTKIDTANVPDHDLLVGGFPCQAFSVAGKRLGFDDTRGTLFFEIARIAKVKRPKAMVLENVKGLVGHDGGKTLDTIIQTLGDIGYTVDFEVLNSKYFGVPQNRERIFIIAVRDDLIEQQPWKIEGTNVVAKGKRRISQLDGVKTFNFDWPTQDSVTTRLRDILESNVDERFYLSEEKTAKLVAQLEGKDTDVKFVGGIDNGSKWLDDGKTYSRNFKQGNRVYDADGIGTALTSQPVGGLGGPTSLYQIDPQMLGHIDLKGHDAIKRVYDTQGISPTLTTMGGGHREPKIAEMKEVASPDDLSYCIDANYTKGIAPSGIGKGRRTHVEETKPRYRIRKLTPRECFRLQGFADSEFDKLTANGISNSQLYKCAGNAVTINVISAIGKRLLPLIKEAE